MFPLLLFVSCVFVASASKCCIPPQWEGKTYFVTTVIHGDKPTTTEGSTTMAYDGINHIMGQYVEENVNGKFTSYGIVMDYNTDTKYIVLEKSCIKTKLNRKVENFGGCIPDNATAGDAASVYGLGSNTVDLAWYQMEFPGVRAYVGLTADGCVPAMEVTRGNLDGNYFMENVNYFNMTLGLTHPEYLQLPPVGCENPQIVESHFTHGNFNPAAVGRRSILF